METLSKENINLLSKISDSNISRQDIPEWDMYFYVKEMSMADRMAFEASHLGKTGKIEATTKDLVYDLIAKSVCDTDGNLLFDSKDDVEVSFGPKSSKVVQKIFEICSKANYDKKIDEDKKKS